MDEVNFALALSYPLVILPFHFAQLSIASSIAAHCPAMPGSLPFTPNSKRCACNLQTTLYSERPLVLSSGHSEP